MSTRLTAGIGTNDLPKGRNHRLYEAWRNMLVTKNPNNIDKNWLFFSNYVAENELRALEGLMIHSATGRYSLADTVYITFELHRLLRSNGKGVYALHGGKSYQVSLNMFGKKHVILHTTDEKKAYEYRDAVWNGYLFLLNEKKIFGETYNLIQGGKENLDFDYESVAGAYIFKL